LALTIAAPYPIHLSEIERNLELARLVGCGETSADLEFPLWDNDRRQAQALLGDVGHARLLVGLHSGAKRPVRRWPAAHFARLGDLLSRRLGATVILTGGPQEAEPLAVQALMREPALNLAGRTTVPVLAALIERSDLLIANDTGPAHLADAVGTPAITLMGPADVSRWRSSQPSHVTFHLPVPCSPCACWECPIDQRCLRWIEPEAVLSAARDVVENGVAA
jgi:ADP-heptose:LPS heptosyltransferase